MLYAHELIQVFNRGLSSEKIIFTGQEEVFTSKEYAIVSQKATKERTGYLPDVYPFDDDGDEF